MSVLLQISMGSLILILCTVLHLVVVAQILAFLRKTRDTADSAGPIRRLSLLSLAILGPIFSHTLHVYIWSLALLQIGALTGYETAIYFTLVTYTTLGYGDLTLDPGFRILGAMSSVTGIIMFGMTTAFLVAVFGRLFQQR